jgi:PAS domain S-box-containing protein
MAERGRAEAAVSDREQALRALVDRLPVAVVVTDQESGHILLANNPARSLLGLSAAAIGADTGSLCAAEDRRRLREALRSDGAVRNQELALVTASGRRLQASVSAVATTLDDRACAVFGIHDLTAERDRERALELARDAAEEASRAKSRFLANMSHEIRTPMNGVLGMADLLLDSPLTPEQRELTQTIRSSGDLLLSVINGILDLSKVEAERVELCEEPFDLVEAIDRSFEPLAFHARNKGLDCRLSFARSTPAHVVGDALRIRQILTNLLGNAVKFTDEGRVDVHVSAVGEAGGWTVRLAVRDTGVGIAPEVLPELFVPFQQGDTTTARRFGGTGLGLAIARRLARLMGGDIVVQSEHGRGTTFVAEVFVARDPALAEAVPLALLVEPEGVLDSAAPLLSSVGYQVCAPGAIPGGRAVALRVVDARRAAEAELGEGPGLWIASTERAAPVGWTTVQTPLRRAAIATALDKVSAVTARAIGARVPLVERLGFTPVVLVAEDNPVNQKIARRMLEKLEVEVEVVEDGHAALEAMRARRYDLVFMDVQMPRLDGLEATRLWRASESDGRLPIVALTAHAMIDYRRTILAAGLDDTITKPVSRDVLEAAVLRWAGVDDGRPRRGTLHSRTGDLQLRRSSDAVAV